MSLHPSTIHPRPEVAPWNATGESVLESVQGGTSSNLRADLPLLAPRRCRGKNSEARLTAGDLEDAYEELIASARMRLARLPQGIHDHESTSLVHDAYVRLMESSGSPLRSPSEVRFAMNRAMHDELVEAARRAASLKHGGVGRKVDLDSLQDELTIDPVEETWLEVQEAVKKLKRNDPVNARIVTLRFFGGLTTEETATVLGCSVTTIERKWRALKEWLARELRF